MRGVNTECAVSEFTSDGAEIHLSRCAAKVLQRGESGVSCVFGHYGIDVDATAVSTVFRCCSCRGDCNVLSGGASCCHSSHLWNAGGVMAITWITGNSGAGKTTLAKKILRADGGILLDGDDMRSCWSLGFSKEDRIENNLRIAHIARVLEKQGFNVVVATICPYVALRAQVKEITNCRFISLDGGKIGEQYPYEP
jgi:hypothetical protein